MFKLQKEFTKFCVVGFISTFVNYTIFFISYEYLGTYYVIASGIGYVAGVSLGYILNRRWTFFESKSHTKKLREFTMYALVYIVSLAAGLFLLKLLVEFFNLNPLFANVLVTGLSATINFTGLKFFVFKKSNTKTIE